MLARNKMQTWFIWAKSLLFAVLTSHPHTPLPNDEVINEQQNNWEVNQLK